MSNITNTSRSILEEISTFVPKKSKEDFIEAKAHNIITSAIHLLDTVDASFSPEEAQLLRRRFINSIQQSDPGKFSRTVRRLKE